MTFSTQVTDILKIADTHAFTWKSLEAKFNYSSLLQAGGGSSSWGQRPSQTDSSG